MPTIAGTFSGATHACESREKPKLKPVTVNGASSICTARRCRSARRLAGLYPREVRSMLCSSPILPGAGLQVPVILLPKRSRHSRSRFGVQSYTVAWRLPLLADFRSSPEFLAILGLPQPVSCLDTTIGFLVFDIRRTGGRPWIAPTARDRQKGGQARIESLERHGEASFHSKDAILV